MLSVIFILHRETEENFRPFDIAMGDGSPFLGNFARSAVVTVVDEGDCLGELEKSVPNESLRNVVRIFFEIVERKFTHVAAIVVIKVDVSVGYSTQTLSRALDARPNPASIMDIDNIRS